MSQCRDNLGLPCPEQLVPRKGGMGLECEYFRVQGAAEGKTATAAPTASSLYGYARPEACNSRFCPLAVNLRRSPCVLSITRRGLTLIDGIRRAAKP
jgi:hypothetical protein